jgi:hypothetical protein
VVNSYNSGTITNRLGTVSLFLQNPEGLLRAAGEYTVGRQPYGSAIGDVNGDGTNEIVVSNEVDNTLQVLSIGAPTAPVVSSPTWPNPAVWVNQPRGSFVVTVPPDMDGIAGYYYTIDRTAEATPNLSASFVTAGAAGSRVTIPYDFRTNPEAAAGVSGTWYLHIRAADTGSPSLLSPTTNYRVLIDVTAPSTPVLAPVPTTWMANNYLPVTWSVSSDGFSGLANYLVYQNGSVVATLNPSTTGYTVAGLNQGANSIGVAAVDNAGNRSPISSRTVYVDSIAPVVNITTPPWVGVTYGGRPTFAATVTDGAGVTRVQFLVDGVLKATDTVAPYSATLNLTSLANGTHTLTVRGFDHLNSTSASRTFILNKTPPTVSSVSVAPNPFYPRLVDGYKDYSIVNFRLSKGATVSLTVTNRGGTVLRTSSAYMAGGSRRIAWNGRTTKGAVVGEGTYYMRVTAVDSLGNASSTGLLPTTVRYYVIVRVAANKAKVVPH